VTDCLCLSLGDRGASDKSLNNGRLLCTRSGGTIIWVAPQKEAGPIMPLVKEMASDETANDFHRRLIRGDIPEALRSFGISYIMQVVYFKGACGKVQCHPRYGWFDNRSGEYDEIHACVDASGGHR